MLPSSKIINNCYLFSKNVFQVNVKMPQLRNYVAVARKRFYKNTNILRNGNKYEITLDQRKLKTPKGNVFTVDSEPLAIAVATEWDLQKEKINQSSMHLTTLCNTVIDNPNYLTKYEMVQYLINYVDTDTILFHAEEENSDLHKFQTQHWDPVIEWFNKRFNVEVCKSGSISAPIVSDKNNLEKYFLSHNFAAVNGYVYAVDTLKSVILSTACVERFISPQKAVLLSRLEEEYQLNQWGRVEWAHDLNQQDLEARLSAAVLFIYFNSSSNFVKSKAMQENNSQ